MAPAKKLKIKTPPGGVGRNRSRRFVKHSILAKQARTLTGRKLVARESELNTVPEGGMSSCFFREYLDEENMQNASKVYSVFYRQAYALVQSQALFVHNLPKLVDMFVTTMSTSEEEDETIVLAVPSLLRLVGSLGRDASGEMLFPHLPSLVQACLAKVEPGNVDLTTLVFETVGKLFECAHSELLQEDPKLDKLHDDFYPNFVGHSNELVRNLAAEVAAFLIRKQASMDQKMHLWSLLRYTGESRLGDATPQVFLHVVRGVAGKFHSVMPKVLGSLIRALARKAEAEEDRVQSLLRWMDALKQFSSSSDELSSILISEFTPGSTFHYRLCAPWLAKDCSRDQLHALIKKMPAAATASSTPADVDFVLHLWNAANTSQADMQACRNLLFPTKTAAPPSVDLLQACVSVLDFASRLVPSGVLSLVPQTWAYAQVWIVISKLSADNMRKTGEALDPIMFSPQSGKVLLTSQFQLPSSSAADLLEFLRWVDPTTDSSSINAGLGELLMTEFPHVEREPADVFGLWALASMTHAQGKSLARITAKLDQDGAYCTRDAMEALCLASSSTLPPAVLVHVSKQLAHPGVDTRVAALKLVRTTVFPGDEALRVLEEIHVLEPTYENERPREVLGDSFKRAMVAAAAAPAAAAPSPELVSVWAFAVLGMFHIRYRPTWVLAGDLLEKLVSARNCTGTSKQNVAEARACWQAIFCFFLQIQAHQPASASRFEATSSSSESAFTALLKAVGSGPILLRMFQRESAQWMPHFFGFLHREYYPGLGENTLVERMTEKEEALARSVTAAGVAVEEAAGEAAEEETNPHSKRKLNAYLELMCVFDQKKSLAELELLLLVWKRVLFVSANAALALRCLQRWQGAKLEKARAVLTLAVNPKEYRGALVEISALFREHQDPVLVDVLSRLLFSKLVEGGSSGGRQRKHSVSVTERRRHILHCFASLEDASGFVDLMLRPFQVISLDKQQPLSSFAKSATEGFLLLLEHVLPILGKRLVPHVDRIASTLCAIVEVATAVEGASLPVLRKEALNRLTEMFRLFATSDAVDFSSTFATVRAVVDKMLAHSTEDDASSALFMLVRTCFHERQIRFRCLSEHVLETAFLGKVAVTKSSEVLAEVFAVVDQMLAEGEFTPRFVDVFLSAVIERRKARSGAAAAHDDDEEEEEGEQAEPQQTAQFAPMGQDELEIVERVAAFAAGAKVDARLVAQLLDLLSDHLDVTALGAAKRSRSSSAAAKAAALSLQLKTMTSLTLAAAGGGAVAVLDSALAGKIRLVLAKMFGPWGKQGMVQGEELALGERETLARLFALYHPAAETPLLLELNKLARNTVQCDYDVPARLAAYQQLCDASSTSSSSADDDMTTAVLLNQALYDILHCTEFSIRLVALAFCKQAIMGSSAPGQQLGPHSLQCLDVGLTFALDKVDTCAVRSNVLAVLRHVVQSDCTGELFHDLRFLASDTEPDADFFLNSSHLQPQRRSKAMSRFAGRHVEACSEHSLTKVILPVAMHAVFDDESRKNEQEAGILLLAACCKQVAGAQTICQLLGKIFARIAKATESRTQRRLYLRTACVLYDEHAGKSAMVDAKFTRRLFKYLVSPRTQTMDEELNENVALSLVERYRRTNNASQPQQLDSLLLVVCGQLKRRKQTARDMARQCLVKLARRLGVNRTFPRILQHLSACLNEGGYQTHVLSYTLFHLLEALQTETVLRGRVEAEGEDEEGGGGINHVDAVVADVLKPILAEMFEKGAATVESGYKSKIKLREVRQGKALDMLECLATCVTFLPAQSIHLLVEPFLARTREDRSSSAFRSGGSSTGNLTTEMNKCKEAFIRLRAGLLKNPSVSKENLLVYCHHALSQHYDPQAIAAAGRDGEDGDYEEYVAEDAIPVKGAAYADRSRYVPGQQLTGTNSHHNGTGTGNKRLKLHHATEKHREHVYIEFVLEWMHQACFSSAALRKTEQLPEGIHLPIVELVVKHIIPNAHSSQKSLVMAMRICTDYFEANADKPSKPLSRTALQSLMYQCLAFLKKNAQSAVLVSADVSKSSVDLVTTLLSTHMVKLRHDDTKILVRICHLDLDNANRFSSALRLLQCLFAALVPTPELYDIALRLNEMVFQHSIKRKEQTRCVELVSHFLLSFPLEKQRLEEHVQLIVKNIGSYEHETGRLGGLQLLMSIISRFPSELIDYFCDFFFVTLCLVLQNDDSNEVKQQTARVLKTLFTKLTKAKLATSVLAFCGKWFANHKSQALACQLAGLLPDPRAFTPQLMQVVEEQQDNDHALYQALVSLERTFVSPFEDVERVPGLKQLMLHPDLWVRQASSRMAGNRLEAHGRLDCVEGFDFLLVLVDQLDSDQISDELAALVLRNLVLLAKTQKVEWFEGKNQVPVPWILHKLCHIASRAEPLDLTLKNRRRRAAFQFFREVFAVSQLGMDVEIVKSIVKALNVIHVSRKDHLDPLGELRDEVLELMKKSVGVDALAAALSEDHKSRGERRQQKRSRRDVERVAPGGGMKKKKTKLQTMMKKRA